MIRNSLSDIIKEKVLQTEEYLLLLFIFLGMLMEAQETFEETRAGQTQNQDDKLSVMDPLLRRLYEESSPRFLELTEWL